MASSTGLPNQVVATYCRQDTRDWADLIAGPAGLITERVLADDVADYLRFRGVCRTWRQCTASPHAYGSLDRRFHPRRWIMLPQTMGDVRKRRTFMNVSTGERLQVSLPELCYQHVFGTSSDGLMVLCDRRTYVIRLINPLTRQLTSLPDATTLQYTASSQQRTSGYTLKFLQVFGAGLADDSTVALHFGGTWLATAKPGDKQWTRPLLLRHREGHHGAGHQPAAAAGLGDFDSTNVRYDRTMKLVDNDGELVLARRIPLDRKNPLRGGYEVHRVDLEAGITLPMQQGFGGRALFASAVRSCGQVNRGIYQLVGN
ncbi:hypothetical protein VPH35_040181 [Triticum aestivum]